MTKKSKRYFKYNTFYNNQRIRSDVKKSVDVRIKIVGKIWLEF